MSIQDTFKKSFLTNFNTGDISTQDIVVTLMITLVLALYIFFIYRVISRKNFYNKSFNVSLAALAMITAAIIITIQSSIVVSLGMVGALSIVRFRTAIKNPMDLLFLFWSIGTGIICGAGLFEIAFVVALMVTVGILILEFMPELKKPYLLIINGTRELDETAVLEIIKKYAKFIKVRSRNLKKNGADYIIEVHTKKEKELLDELDKMETISQLSLLSHEGEVRV